MRPATARKAHTFLSLFFAPLLVLFVVTGCWQTLIPQDIRDGDGWASQLLDKLSTVHKDAYFPRAGEADPSTAAFKIIVGLMGAAMLATILLGLYLAWRASPQKTAIALALGVAVPALVLWLA